MAANNRKPLARRRFRCLGCGIAMHVGNGYGIRDFCPDCARGSWRVVYDRDRALGEIPPNLRSYAAK